VNKYRTTPLDIHARIFRFTVNCFLEVVRKIPKSTETLPIISQISSSLTSMGANDQEADAAGSKRDFIAKYMIVRKETKETYYWLSFLKQIEVLPATLIDPYLNECKQIQNIVSKILQNLSQS
jgi:four helix bundle protein